MWPSFKSTSDVHYLPSFLLLFSVFDLAPFFLFPWYLTLYCPWYYTQIHASNLEVSFSLSVSSRKLLMNKASSLSSSVGSFSAVSSSWGFSFYGRTIVSLVFSFDMMSSSVSFGNINWEETLRDSLVEMEEMATYVSTLVYSMFSVVLRQEVQGTQNIHLFQPWDGLQWKRDSWRHIWIWIHKLRYGLLEPACVRYLLIFCSLVLHLNT